jgi:DmsE family decaheme c-type cytochrome
MLNHLQRRRIAVGTGLGAAWLWTLMSVVMAAPLPGIRQATAAGTAAAQAAPPSGYVGEATCVGCHEAEGKSIHATPHGRAENPRTPMAARGCESCHGPGQKHVESGEKTDIRSFTAITSRQVSETCLTCHARTHQNFQGGPHDSRNMTCITCHSVHAPKSAKFQLKTATQVATCAACHRTQAMKIQRITHMPVREGAMECSSCHNPHGSTNVKQLKVGFSVNEMCLTCHTEKRGPFLWEHMPVAESCVTCHDPHGSSNDRLLVAKVPMLCQRCHAHTRHPATPYDETQVDNNSNRVLGRGCVKCHQNVHGSNHPSGALFLR